MNWLFRGRFNGELFLESAVSISDFTIVRSFPNIAAFDGREPRFDLMMKAKIIVTPKKAVLDPQGKTVQTALEHMGYEGVGAVHVGKYMEIELTGSDKEAARKAIDDACHKLLSNPVIEDYRFEIE